jgi:anti-anti-sigma factor
MTEPSYRYIVPARHANVLVITVTEPMLRDAITCYGLRDEIISAIDTAPVEVLVLDLTSVEFIGSVGFLAFLSARRHLGAEVILCGMSENVHEMFRVCGLTSRGSGKQAPFAVAVSVESALGLG